MAVLGAELCGDLVLSVTIVKENKIPAERARDINTIRRKKMPMPSSRRKAKDLSGKESKNCWDCDNN